MGSKVARSNKKVSYQARSKQILTGSGQEMGGAKGVHQEVTT